MAHLIVLAVAILCYCTKILSCQVEVDCPPWTIFNSTNGNCQCGSDLYGIVQCDEDSLSVQKCYCMTYSEELNKTILSYCFYTCRFTLFVDTYPITTRNTSDLNDAMCKDFNRTGVMCGECIAGHAPPVYSYSAACVECKDYKYNWIKYIAVAYLPLTLFYIIIVLLKISVNSAPMIAYVAISQIISAPGLIRWFTDKHLYSSIYLAPQAIWNLDFFRGLYHPFCLHPNLSVLQVTCLDYIVGLYPLLLIFITYCMVQLHGRYVVISKLWRPVYKVCSLLRKEWNIRESLVSVFATFLVLSYTKTLNVSVDILTFNRAAYDTSGTNTGLYYLLINGSTPYFSREHIPYAVIAACMLTILNLLPLVLLCVYPCACFQKCLNTIRCHFLLIHTFMDTFQGCFREKPRDCRYFAGYYIFVRLANLVILTLLDNVLYFWGVTLLFLLTIILLAVCKPYKSSKRNAIDIFLLCSVVMFFSTYSAYLESIYVLPISAHLIYLKVRGFFIVLSSFIPCYGIYLILHQMVKLLCKVTRCNCLKSLLLRKKEEMPLLYPFPE